MDALAEPCALSYGQPEQTTAMIPAQRTMPPLSLPPLSLPPLSLPPLSLPPLSAPLVVAK